MRQLIGALLLLAIVASISLVSSAAERERTHILQIKHGKVNGYFQDVGNGKKLMVYEGLRYGRAKRFEKPEFMAPWTYVYPAESPREACPQFGSIPGMKQFELNQTTSEDCLYLNLWRPAEEKPNRPVMVWIHGGAFETGTIFQAFYDGRQLAHQGDLIVVAIQYRLGPLGFISGGKVPPNLGLHDQILALKWVQENIQYFGGDPKQVTIFGESAGSMSVGALIISPLAKGLFSRAIMQSGAPSTDDLTLSLSKSLQRTQDFAHKLHCPVDGKKEQVVECIKAKSIKELHAATANDLVTNQLFAPVFGDEVLPLRPTEALKTGKFNHVDLIYGVTRDEGTMFAPMFVPEIGKVNLTIQSTREFITRMLGVYGRTNIATEVADYYLGKLHNPSQDDLKLAISNVWGDMVLVCPTILFGEAIAKHSTHQIFAYRLMQVASLPGFDIPKWMGVHHGQDLFYLFLSEALKKNASQYELAQTMIKDWTMFAKNGVPSAHWRPAFDRGHNDFATHYLNLEVSHLKMVSGHFKQTCDTFWKPKIFA